MALITIKEIEEKATEFKDIFERNDSDMDKYFIKKYEMLGFDGLPIPKIVNITLPDLALFAAQCIGILQGAEPNIVAKSQRMGEEQLRPIERLANDLLLTADEYRSFRDRPPLYLYKVEQSCIRGRTATQVLCRKEKGEWIIDLRSLDSRYHIYDIRASGMNWSAYAVRHSRSYLKEKFNKDIGDNLSAICWDVHDRTRHYVYCYEGTGSITATTPAGSESADLIHDTLHPFRHKGKGYVPVVAKKVPAGSMLAHPDAIVHDGESIFALSRDLYPEMNRIATVLHNLTMASFFGARQYASEAGEGKETDAIPFGLGVVISIEKGGGYTLIPVNDIKNASRLEYSMLDSRMQRATLPPIESGNLTFSLSAVAIGRLKEAKELIFVPRLRNLSEQSKGEIKMAFRQLQAVGGEIELGEEGHRTKYNTADLEGEYALQVEYFAESKEEKLAAITEAQSQRGLIPDRAIRIETLHRPDPDGDEDALRDEASERADPAIAMYNRLHSLIDKSDAAAEAGNNKLADRFDMRAKMTLNGVIMLLKQRAMQKGLTFPEGQQRGLLPQGEQQESSIPLLGGGDGAGSRSVKTDEQRRNEEMDEEERIGRLAETGRQGRPIQSLTGRG